jgi:hypothetical protein
MVWHSSCAFYHSDTDSRADWVPLLQNIRVSYLIHEKYTNLRCAWAVGCPTQIDFHNKPLEADSTANHYREAFEEMFPNEILPSKIAAACCAQFALTRDKIHERPIEDYKRYRDWLLDTSLSDDTSGRIFEYSWHIIFGKPPEHCPNAKACYCNIYGLCALECHGEGHCGGQWVYPQFSTLPLGWPRVGWDGESRDDATLEQIRSIAVAAGNKETKRIE